MIFVVHMVLPMMVTVISYVSVGSQKDSNQYLKNAGY